MEEDEYRKSYTATVKYSVEYTMDMDEMNPEVDLMEYIKRQHYEHHKGTSAMGVNLDITIKEEL